MPLQRALVAEAEPRIAGAVAASDGARQLVDYFVGQVVGQMDRSKPATQVLMEMVEGYIDAANSHRRHRDRRRRAGRLIPGGLA